MTTDELGMLADFAACPKCGYKMHFEDMIWDIENDTWVVGGCVLCWEPPALEESDE